MPMAGVVALRDQLRKHAMHVAAVVGLIGLVAEGTFLTYTYGTVSLGFVGSVKLSSILLFDVGVYLVVVGAVATMVLALEEDEG